MASFSPLVGMILLIGIRNVAFSSRNKMASSTLLTGVILLILSSNMTFSDAQRVILYTNNPTPSYTSIVDLFCHYPDVMEMVDGQPRYLVTTASWRVNREYVFPDENVFDQRPINQTSSRLRVRIDPANFTGDPVNFTCYLPLTSGGEDSASTVVDPQGSGNDMASLSSPHGVASNDSSAVRVLSDNPTPCYDHTVDIFCYYPHVMERVNGQPRYIVPTPSWRVNGEPLIFDPDIFDQRSNQTVSKLIVRIDPANFTGDPVNFTCYLPLTSGGEDSASTVVDPQDTAAPPTFTDPVVSGTSATVSWNHTNKGPCFNHLTFSYNIIWYPVVGGMPQREEGQSGMTGPGATEYIINNLMNNTEYQVDLMGYAPSDPPVFSVVATVNFTTGVPPTDVSPTGGGGGDNTATIAGSVTAVLVVVGVMITIVAIAITAYCYEKVCYKK